MPGILDGYPQPSGVRMESVIYKAGPSSYTQVVTGSPPTGGQAVNASEFGLKYLDHVEATLSDDGQYFVYFTPKVTGKAPVSAGILMWVVAAGGAEVAAVANLSARQVRLRAIGLA